MSSSLLEASSLYWIFVLLGMFLELWGGLSSGLELVLKQTVQNLRIADNTIHIFILTLLLLLGLEVREGWLKVRKGPEVGVEELDKLFFGEFGLDVCSLDCEFNRLYFGSLQFLDMRYQGFKSWTRVFFVAFLLLCIELSDDQHPDHYSIVVVLLI